MAQTKVWEDNPVNGMIELILSLKNMKQDKIKPYQVYFLSTHDIVNKDKDKINRIKRGTFISGEINLRRQWLCWSTITIDTLLDLVLISYNNV